MKDSRYNHSAAQLANYIFDFKELDDYEEHVVNGDIPMEDHVLYHAAVVLGRVDELPKKNIRTVVIYGRPFNAKYNIPDPDEEPNEKVFSGPNLSTYRIRVEFSSLDLEEALHNAQPREGEVLINTVELQPNHGDNNED